MDESLPCEFRTATNGLSVQNCSLTPKSKILKLNRPRQRYWPPLLDGSTSGNDVEQDYDDGDDQQNMDQTARGI